MMQRELRATLPLTDALQSTSSVVDLVSNDVLELSTFYPNGAKEHSWTSTNSSHQQELPQFTGKEDDEELGIVYFGERYLVPRTARWASPDPLSIHALGGGEFSNAFHYVSGNSLQARDPLGLDGCSCAPDVPANPEAVQSFRAAYETAQANGVPSGTPRRTLNAIRSRRLAVFGTLGLRHRRSDAHGSLGESNTGFPILSFNMPRHGSIAVHTAFHESVHVAMYFIRHGGPNSYNARVRNFMREGGERFEGEGYIGRSLNPIARTYASGIQVPRGEFMFEEAVAYYVGARAQSLVDLNTTIARISSQLTAHEITPTEARARLATAERHFAETAAGRRGDHSTSSGMPGVYAGVRSRATLSANEMDDANRLFLGSMSTSARGASGSRIEDLESQISAAEREHVETE
jgi:RHS repeat-associated protein